MQDRTAHRGKKKKRDVPAYNTSTKGFPPCAFRKGGESIFRRQLLEAEGGNVVCLFLLNYLQNEEEGGRL